MAGLIGSTSRLASPERAEQSRFFELARWASRAEFGSLHERAATSRARLGSFPPLVRCHTGQVLFTVRCASYSMALTLRTLFLCERLLQSTVARVSRCSAGAPDSPVNYNRVCMQKPESGWLDSVRSWCIGHCPVAHRTVRCARPQHTWFILLLWIWSLTWIFIGLYWTFMYL